MKEGSKREKEAGIVPDTDIDAYMKVTISIDNNFTLKTFIESPEENSNITDNFS